MHYLLACTEIDLYIPTGCFRGMELSINIGMVLDCLFAKNLQSFFMDVYFIGKVTVIFQLVCCRQFHLLKWQPDLTLRRSFQVQLRLEPILLSLNIHMYIHVH